MRKKSPYFRTSSFSNMAVRGGLTRCARPTGSPLASLPVCPTGCRQLSNPGRVFSSPPQACNMRKKSPYFRTSSHLEYGGGGGIDSLRSPYGQPARFAPGLSNWLSPVVEPRSGILIPPAGVQYAKKKPVLSYELSSRIWRWGGIDSLRSPYGQPVRFAPGLSNWLSPVVEPRSGILIPPLGEYKRKKPVLSYELSSRIWR
jgi:hypothetical protein